MEGRRALVKGPSRREFFGAPALIGLWRKTDRKITGTFVNDSFPLGHRLRDRASFRTPARQVRVPIVIVGGGMAGLNAAWHLDKRGFHDFVLLEMEQHAGGNSRWGENEISKFPWAAHYVPVPAKGESLARELFEELGVFRDGKWDERVLCFDPQERLFINGHWQEGIEPEDGATARDRGQYRKFVEKIAEFRASGQFTVPMERGAKASTLDRMSMTDWLVEQGFDSAALRWYINYACRDDYGALAKDTSAWAGIQYFASRAPEEKGPLTWPQGNGWIAGRLIEKLKRYVRTGGVVYGVRGGHKIQVLTEQTEYLADAVIWAAPTFLASYVVDGAPRADGFQYSPWLTANLTLDRIPDRNNAEPAWDNVIYDSPALGYVNATHMSLATHVDRTVWTFYWSLGEYAPADARRLLLAKDWNYWKVAILNDLARAHPDIRQCVAHMDIMRIGHAMARPSPGFLFSEQRERWLKPLGNIFFANSDLSGFSIFEEAQYRGVEAAKGALRLVGRG
jgi:hypothetical protein